MNLCLGQFEPIWYPTKVTVKFMTNQTFHKLNVFFFFLHFWQILGSTNSVLLKYKISKVLILEEQGIIIRLGLV